MTTANKITLLRVALVPIFVGLVLSYTSTMRSGEPQEWQRFTAILVFLLAAATDFVDGWLARRQHQMSRFGRLLDPIADKAVLLSALAMMTFYSWGRSIPIWFLVLVLVRDGIVILGYFILRVLRVRIEVRPSWTGKLATALQMLAIGWVMLQISEERVAIFLAATFTVVSGMEYSLRGYFQWKQKQAA